MEKDIIATSLLNGGWPVTFIRVISVWNNLAMVWFAVSFSAANKLVYHLSAYQMTIIDV